MIGLGYVGLPLVELFAGKGFPGPGLRCGCDQGGTAPGRAELHRAYRLGAGGRVAGRRPFRGDVRLRPPESRPMPSSSACRPPWGCTASRTSRLSSPPAGRSANPSGRGNWWCWRAPPIPARRAMSCAPILEAGGLAAGRDFFLAYSPEREDPGNPDYSARNIPKVVGGWDEASGELARLLYEAAVPRVVPVIVVRSGRGLQDPREHLPGRQYRPGQRAEDGLRAHGDRRLGGDRRGEDQAVRLPGLLSRARAWADTASRSIRST